MLMIMEGFEVSMRSRMLPEAMRVGSFTMFCSPKAYKHNPSSYAYKHSPSSYAYKHSPSSCSYYFDGTIKEKNQIEVSYVFLSNKWYYCHPRVLFLTLRSEVALNHLTGHKRV